VANPNETRSDCGALQTGGLGSQAALLRSNAETMRAHAGALAELASIAYPTVRATLQSCAEALAAQADLAELDAETADAVDAYERSRGVRL
jgi:hypothetical protein